MCHTWIAVAMPQLHWSVLGILQLHSTAMWTPSVRDTGVVNIVAISVIPCLNHNQSFCSSWSQLPWKQSADNPKFWCEGFTWPDAAGLVFVARLPWHRQAADDWGRLGERLQQQRFNVTSWGVDTSRQRQCLVLTRTQGWLQHQVEFSWLLLSKNPCC